MTWMVWMMTLDGLWDEHSSMQWYEIWGGFFNVYRMWTFYPWIPTLAADSGVGNCKVCRPLSYPHTSVQAVSALSLPKDLKIILG